MSEYILEMNNITKEFSGVKAIDNVNLKIEEGEIHGLCGENGAGKSTLMKVLSGVYTSNEYEGEIIFEGEKCEFNNIKDSEQKGIVIIHQELALIPHMSIADNIFLGNELSNRGIIDSNQTIQIAEELLSTVGLHENPNNKIINLSVGKQQLVEIAKAISKKVKVLILDEPTAALNEQDSENLLNLLLEFKKNGMTCIIISHKLNEIMAVADRITILRDGQTVNTWDKIQDNVSEDLIIKSMVGRELTNRYPDSEAEIGEKYFEVIDWNVYHPIYRDRQIVKDANFYIKKGEVVGIAGLMGAGRTELAMSIFGKSYGSNISGTLKKDGVNLDIRSVKEAIDNGLAYATEDRKNNGLVLIDNINRNISLASLEKISNNGVIDQNKETDNAEKYQRQLRIKSNSIFQIVESLSGGNQQKVVLAKWLLSNPDVLFLDEPTRGIDVGAKYEIYQIIQQMASEGKAICVISSELPEVIGICDRIYAMSNGTITGEVSKEEATQERLMELMTEEVKTHGGK